VSESIPIATFTANDLRRLAEAVDGMRDKDLIIVIEGHKLVARENLGAEQIPGAIHVHTVGHKKQKPTKVTLRHPRKPKKIKVDTDVFDCVFWGEAACHKFLIPYYVRFYSDAQMQKLRNAISNDDVIAIAHAYPTRDVEIRNEDPTLPPLIPDAPSTNGLYVLGSRTDTESFLDEDWEPFSAWAARQP
jgi:hypothetical protein